MNETDDTHEWDHEPYWHTVRARDDLLPDGKTLTELRVHMADRRI